MEPGQNIHVVWRQRGYLETLPGIGVIKQKDISVDKMKALLSMSSAQLGGFPLILYVKPTIVSLLESRGCLKARYLNILTAILYPFVDS